MQTTSALYNTIYTDPNHWFETQLVIDGVGTYGETQLFSITTSLEMFHGTPTVGSAVAGEINVQMVYPRGVTIPVMAKLKPQVRVCRDLGEEVDGEWVVTRENSEWLDQGIYYIDTRERSVTESGESVLELHGYDAMLKAEQMFVSSTITGDSVDTDMVDEIASIIGVSVDPRTYSMMTGHYTIPLPTGYSCREVLGYIASAYSGCFIMTESGELRLVTIYELPPETNYLIDQLGDAITFGGDRILV